MVSTHTFKVHIHSRCSALVQRWTVQLCLQGDYQTGIISKPRTVALITILRHIYLLSNGRTDWTGKAKMTAHTLFYMFLSAPWNHHSSFRLQITVYDKTRSTQKKIGGSIRDPVVFSSGLAFFLLLSALRMCRFTHISSASNLVHLLWSLYKIWGTAHVSIFLLLVNNN